MLCSELENEAVLPLLMPTPNGQQSLGSNRDRFIMQPASTSAELLQWYEMLGVLMAMALLQKETVVSLSLCSVRSLVITPTVASVARPSCPSRSPRACERSPNSSLLTTY